MVPPHPWGAPKKPILNRVKGPLRLQAGQGIDKCLQERDC